MTKISRKIQTTFMPHKTCRLITQTYMVVLDCLAYGVYFKAIQSQPKKHNDWLIATGNAYYDLCVLRWCMLFGNESGEPTHFYHLISNNFKLNKILKAMGNAKPNKTWLKDYILSKANINHSEFHKYRANTLKYRNKNLIHREHNPKFIHDKCMHFPKTHRMLKTAFSLYELIINIAAEFPEIPSTKNKYRFDCIILKNRKELAQYYLNTYPLTKASKK